MTRPIIIYAGAIFEHLLLSFPNATKEERDVCHKRAIREAMSSPWCVAEDKKWREVRKAAPPLK